MNNGIQPMAWFAELMEEVQRFREEERALSNGVTLKNAILCSITFVAVLVLILGMGVMDSTGSIVAAYPLVLPSFGWLALFAYVNKDEL